MRVSVQTFAETIARVREAFRIVGDSTICVFGCEQPVREGPRTYWEPAPVRNGICSRCHRPRYKSKP